jgi:diaminohydroxyphosphoribosylaminopyrimidine deaminase / 5-amino-6-(5-phosphoribosylamino)uracil reductase
MTALSPETWRRLLRRAPADAGLSPLYGPLLAPPMAADGCFVLGRLAQSLDGRIATMSGASHWISGQDDIVHTHRLRALSDAVVIGAGTVRADNPQLTTREVEGRSPVRVVLDTDRRLDARYRVFCDGPETLLLCAADAAGEDRLGRAPVLRLPRAREGLDIVAVLAALAERGLRRIFVEGGGITVSRFLAAGALDRLHVTIAPLLIGSGIPAFTLPQAATLIEGLRFDWSVHRLGVDLLVDIPLSRARPGTCA